MGERFFGGCPIVIPTELSPVCHSDGAEPLCHSDGAEPLCHSDGAEPLMSFRRSRAPYVIPTERSDEESENTETPDAQQHHADRNPSSIAETQRVLQNAEISRFARNDRGRAK